MFFLICIFCFFFKSVMSLSVSTFKLLSFQLYHPLSLLSHTDRRPVSSSIRSRVVSSSHLHHRSFFRRRFFAASSAASSGRRQKRHRRGNDDAQWARSTKNPDVSTGPLPRPFARSLTRLTRSLSPDSSLCSRPPLRSLVCSLAHFAHSLARGKVNFSFLKMTW